MSNIYLHEFDEYIGEVIDKHSSKAKYITKRNPSYDKITRRVQYLRDKYPIVSNRSSEVFTELKNLAKMRRSIPSRLSNGIRVRYIRFVDEWVVGIYGSESLVKDLSDQIVNYLTHTLKIDINKAKVRITNLLRNKSEFLGYYFMIYRPKVSRCIVFKN